MRLAIMQPYFFPYIGYFQLINSVDRFILANGVQYIRHGWINRNRMLTPANEGFSYITIPIRKHSSKAVIQDIFAVDNDEWKVQIVRQIDHYKKKAPYYHSVGSLLSHCFATKERNVTKINAFLLKSVCDYIGINFKVEIQSEMNFDYSMVHDACERPIRMCEQLGATEYINPIGGKELYDKERFEAKNIKLTFLQSKPVIYDQYRSSFEPGLSILDVMMFNSPNDIKAMLNEYQLS